MNFFEHGCRMAEWRRRTSTELRCRWGKRVAASQHCLRVVDQRHAAAIRVCVLLGKSLLVANPRPSGADQLVQLSSAKLVVAVQHAQLVHALRDRDGKCSCSHQQRCCGDDGHPEARHHLVLHDGQLHDELGSVLQNGLELILLLAQHVQVAFQEEVDRGVARDVRPQLGHHLACLLHDLRLRVRVVADADKAVVEVDGVTRDERALGLVRHDDARTRHQLQLVLRHQRCGEVLVQHQHRQGEDLHRERALLPVLHLADPADERRPHPRRHLRLLLQELRGRVLQGAHGDGHVGQPLLAVAEHPLAVCLRQPPVVPDGRRDVPRPEAEVCLAVAHRPHPTRAAEQPRLLLLAAVLRLALPARKPVHPVVEQLVRAAQEVVVLPRVDHEALRRAVVALTCDEQLVRVHVHVAQALLPAPLAAPHRAHNPAVHRREEAKLRVQVERPQGADLVLKLGERVAPRQLVLQVLLPHLHRADRRLARHPLPHVARAAQRRARLLPPELLQVRCEDGQVLQRSGEVVDSHRARRLEARAVLAQRNVVLLRAHVAAPHEPQRVVRVRDPRGVGPHRPKPPLHLAPRAVREAEVAPPAAHLAHAHNDLDGAQPRERADQQLVDKVAGLSALRTGRERNGQGRCRFGAVGGLGPPLLRLRIAEDACGVGAPRALGGGDDDRRHALLRRHHQV
eukprot:Rhum_TRINITY_DN15757_c0_g1::Rhum_TRINITY_DN15757_c0_g1_i1::g.162026::m.162026